MLQDGIRVLIWKERETELFIFSMWRCSKPRRKSPQRTKSANPLILDFPGSRSSSESRAPELWKPNSCSFTISSLWYSVNGNWSWLTQVKHRVSPNWLTCSRGQLFSSKPYMVSLRFSRIWKIWSRVILNIIWNEGANAALPWMKISYCECWVS